MKKKKRDINGTHLFKLVYRNEEFEKKIYFLIGKKRIINLMHLRMHIAKLLSWLFGKVPYFASGRLNFLPIKSETITKEYPGSQKT